EQVAHAEALNAAARFPLGDEDLAYTLCEMLPENVGGPASARSGGAGGGTSMHDIWHVARFMEARRVCREDMELHDRCWNCGQPGHHSGNC
uniref:CCHC-type domain-containing protein n=2 Tax=Oryza brachyantha TaxID=4533 RepID=J3MT15_ORYBR